MLNKCPLYLFHIVHYNLEFSDALENGDVGMWGGGVVGAALKPANEWR